MRDKSCLSRALCLAKNEEKKAKHKTASAFGVNFMRNQALCWAAQSLTINKQTIMMMVSIEV